MQCSFHLPGASRFLPCVPVYRAFDLRFGSTCRAHALIFAVRLSGDSDRYLRPLRTAAPRTHARSGGSAPRGQKRGPWVTQGARAQCPSKRCLRSLRRPDHSFGSLQACRPFRRRCLHAAERRERKQPSRRAAVARRPRRPPGARRARLSAARAAAGVGAAPLPPLPPLAHALGRPSARRGWLRHGPRRRRRPPGRRWLPACFISFLRPLPSDAVVWSP